MIDSKYLDSIFKDIEDGDIKVLPMNDVNVNSLRTRAGELNKAAGFQRYRVSVDTFLGQVRVSSNYNQ